MTMAMASDASYSAEAIPILRPDRPALVVTSTSWTADERFDIFLEALRIYEQRARTVNATAAAAASGKGGEGLGSDDVARRPRLPKLMAVVTGKGDLREQSMANVLEIEEREEWGWVRCRSIWLSEADYPALLGALYDDFFFSSLQRLWLGTAN